MSARAWCIFGGSTGAGMVSWLMARFGLPTMDLCIMNWTPGLFVEVISVFIDFALLGTVDVAPM